MNKTSNSKIAFKNVSSNLLLQFVVIISGFIMPKLLISSFGSDTYGLVASITQFLSLIMLLEAGIGPVIKAKLYKYIASDDKNKILQILKSASKFFNAIGYIFIIYVAILCFVFPLINDEFEQSLTVTLILIMAISTLFEYFFGIVYNLYLQADKKYYVVSYVQIFCYIFNILLVVFLIYMGASIVVVKIANTVAFIIKPIFQYYYVRKKLKIDYKKVTEDYKIENKFDGLSQHVAYVINVNTNVLVLTAFTNLATVAVYSIYNLVTTAVDRVVGAFTNGMDSIFGDMFARNERESLTKSFGMYEFVYYSVAMIVYLPTLILIIPFVRIYTSGITDANYIQPIFAILLVIFTLFSTTRYVYSSLIYSVGHFKQTNLIVWLEAIINVVLSVVLVYNLGLIGVAIGSLVAALFRLICFMHYSSKVILQRNFMKSFKWLFIVFFQLIVIILFMHFNIINYVPTDYLTWAFYALIVLILSTVFVIFVNVLCNFTLAKDVFQFIKGKLFKNKVH